MRRCVTNGGPTPRAPFWIGLASIRPLWARVGMPAWFTQLDDRAGDGLEAALRWQHRRRLRRLGWGGALDPATTDEPWSERGTTVRAGNGVEPLVDGAEALPAIQRAILGATRSVHIAC